MKEGIFDGISNADYHADKETYSSSLIKLMHTPALAKHAMNEPHEQKEVYRIGTAIHIKVLEPELFTKQFFTGINVPRRGKDNLTEWADFFAIRGGYNIVDNFTAAEWYGEFEKQTGMSILTPDEIEFINLMAESVSNNKIAFNLLKDGKSEQSIYWTDEETGLNLRVRPDYLGASISDLKSTKSAYAPFFAKSAYDLGYHISQAMYQDGIEKVTGEYKDFKFICVEKKEPYLCAVHSFNNESIAFAEKKYREYLRKLASCIDLDYWQGYENKNNLSLPAYLLKD